MGYPPKLKTVAVEIRQLTEGFAGGGVLHVPKAWLP